MAISAKVQAARDAVTTELAALVAADGGRYRVAERIGDMGRCGTLSSTDPRVVAAEAYLRLPGVYAADQRRYKLEGIARAWQVSDVERRNDAIARTCGE